MEKRKSPFVRAFIAAGERTNTDCENQLEIACNNIRSEKPLSGLASVMLGFTAGTVVTFGVPLIIERPRSAPDDRSMPFTVG